VTDASFEEARSIVEKAIAKIGLAPDDVRAKDSGTPGQMSWTLQRGSAALLLSLATRTEVFFRAISPILIPDPAKKLELYERCLELNAHGIGTCAFGVMSDRIVVVSERPAKGMDVDEVEQIVRHVGAVADTFDDRLQKEFGGKRASDKS
jgi:hypothetical protein